MPELKAMSADANEQLMQLVQACVDSKASQPRALDLRGVLDIADYFLIVSGRSDRHVLGICNRIIQTAETLGIEVNSIEGTDQAHWVLIDLGAITVHVFYEPVRERYALEQLWCNAQEVNLRLDNKNLQAA